MQAPIHKTTFIVRLWTDGDPTDESSWRGIAERVGAERQCKFTEFGVLLDWMRHEIVIVQERNDHSYAANFGGARVD